MKRRRSLDDSTPATRLRHRVDQWAVRLKVSPRQVRIISMRTKWGSCSAKGIVTLAIDLDDQARGFQDYVIVHELLHLKVKNHSKLFKALMSAHLPGWKSIEHHRLMRAA
ncbi:MAG: M48 family metallopeptidase [Proteobacteria bacterium]|nr:M48 family metallopeptidase [Pseudomonadota bacterium]